MNMTIVYMAAIWMIVIGVIRIVIAYKIHSVKKELGMEFLGRRWWLVMLIGALMVVCGVFSLFNPDGMIIALGISLGLSIVIAGANLVAIAT